MRKNAAETGAACLVGGTSGESPLEEPINVRPLQGIIHGC